MKNFSQTLLALTMVLPMPGFSAEELTDLDEPDLVYVGSTPIEQINPDYPKAALSRGEEGWVQMSFIVTKEGAVTDSMIKDSSGNEEFEKAALIALNKWKFEPAKVGENPVDSSETETIFRFQLEEPAVGAGRPFIKKYREINELLKTGNTVEVEAKLTELRFVEKNNLYEDAWFWWLDTAYAQSIDDRFRMHESVEKALALGDSYLSEDMFVQASQMAYLLSLDSSSFKDALNYLDKLKESKRAKKAASYEKVVATLEEHAMKVRSFVAGSALIEVAGKIGDNSYWYHSLSRNAFSLGEVQGKIAAIEIRCNFYRVRRFEFLADVEWRIPENWQDCSVFVRGDEGTTFKLYELPGEQAPAVE